MVLQPRDASAPTIPSGAAPGAAPVSLATVRDLLRGLNREQRRAVTHTEGPLLVIAGPGTGKTEVITRRIAWLIATKRARPSEVLALTFTDKAADAMQARVDLLVPYGQADAAIHTFHAFGDRLVREFAHELRLPPDVRVVGRADAVLLVREHLFELGLERYLPLGDPTRFIGALLDLFARLKDRGVAPVDHIAYAEWLADRAVELGAAAAPAEEIAATERDAGAQAELAGAYARYQALLASNGLIDFGDQVALAARLLREDPAVRRELGARYRYVLVDEFQDTDAVQLRLLRALVGERGNVTVVGDDDQSIYAFRGAALANLLGFGQAFDSHRLVVLRRNYRSRLPILQASRRLIRHNDPARLEAREGIDKVLLAHRRSRRPAPVRLGEYLTVAEEADAVATEIARRIGDGERPSDFAILVRTNADIDPYVRSLSVLGVPWRSGATTGLYARPEIRELLAFLRTVADPESTVDLYGLASGSLYGLGGADLTALLESARRRHRSLWSVCLELEERPGLLRLAPATRDALRRLVRDVRAACSLAHERPAGEVLYDHLKRSGRLARLVAGGEPAADEQLQNIARFFEIVRERSRLLADDRMPFLARHLDALVQAGDTVAEVDALEEREAVAVLTVHKAKGLEFRVVFVVGLADGRFPGRGRRELLPVPPELTALTVAPVEEAPLAEERRLFYVAMTRARDELVLSYARDDGGRRARRPSPFIAEALDRPVAQVHGMRPSAAERLAAFASAPAAPVPAPPARPESLSLSFSQVDAYLTCPQRYRLRHVVGLPTPPHHALVVGNALHQAVAAFHQRQARGRPMEEVELLDVYAAHWTSEGFVSREHEDARFAAGRGALLRFRAAQLAGGVPAPTAVERTFAFAVGRDVVRGRYDRVDESPEGVVITDYKSSDVRDAAKAAEKARDSLQLQIYALAHEAETGRLPVAVQLHFLESGVVGRAVPDPARLARARQKVAAAAEGIRAGRFEPRPDYMACGMCPFRSVCDVAAA